jgi:hypothetical protein
METAKRRIAGAVFVLESVINLAAAYVWTPTGDVHRAVRAGGSGSRTGWGASCRPAA